MRGAALPGSARRAGRGTRRQEVLMSVPRVPARMILNLDFVLTVAWKVAMVCAVAALAFLAVVLAVGLATGVA